MQKILSVEVVQNKKNKEFLPDRFSIFFLTVEKTLLCLNIFAMRILKRNPPWTFYFNCQQKPYPPLKPSPKVGVERAKCTTRA
jgi:hypothetical protein